MTGVDNGLGMAGILWEAYLEAVPLGQEKRCREFNKGISWGHKEEKRNLRNM